MICPRCGYNNQSEGTQDGRCEECGYMGFKILAESASFNIALAPLEQRLLARILDIFVAFALFFAVTFVTLLSIILVGILSNSSTALSELISSIGVSIGFLIALLYSLLADGLKGGQSYGKRIMKITVIDVKSRKPCTFIQSFARNLLLQLITTIDCISIIFSDKRQRLGDRIANTIVIKKHQ